ncbi:MAG: hypothetical protein ABI678_24300 [Kofleriaceae bacterium]
MTRPGRLAILASAIAAALVVGGCDKPSSEDCEKALHNMQRLLGTDSFNDTASIQGEVRRCRGGSSKTAVACAIKAETLEDLNKCDFEKTGKRGGLGSATGSAAHTPAPAAGSGSAAP